MPTPLWKRPDESGEVEFVIYVTDVLGQRQAILDDVKTGRFALRYNGVSTWELYGATRSEGADALIRLPRSGIEVWANDKLLLTGPRNYIEGSNEAGGRFTASGVDDMAWLNARVALPDPITGSFTTQAYDVLEGDVGAVLAQLADRNAGAAALPARRVPRFVVRPPAPIGTNVTVRARFQNLLTLMADTATAAGVGFVVRDMALEVYQPRELSVVISEDLGNLQSYRLRQKAPSINAVYVGGSGELTARAVVLVEDAASIASWDRRESFKDQRQTEDGGELLQAGQVEIADSAEPDSLDATVGPDSSGQDFLVDYGLGDRVLITLLTEVVGETIREVRIGLDENRPPEIRAVIGQVERLDLFRRVNRLERRTRVLEVV